MELIVLMSFAGIVIVMGLVHIRSSTVKCG